MPSLFNFVFVDEAHSDSPTVKYPCFFCQIECFGLSAHFEKYPEHANNLSDDLNKLYLCLIALHCAEHDSQAVSQKQTKTSLNRIHPKSLFYFRLAREWIENLVVIDAKLKLRKLREGTVEL